MPNRYGADVTPQMICEAKWRIAQQFNETELPKCRWGQPNPENPEVQFAGCAACKNAALSDVTVQQAEDDMLKFMWEVRGIEH